jgi:uncharacterized protein Veg
MLYEVDFDYSVREGGSVTLHANNPDDAEFKAKEHIKEIYEDVFDVEIVEVREVSELA